MFINGTLAISIGTLAVAVVIAVITYQQHLTNRLRLRHELFERRFAIFKTTQVYLSKIMQEGGLKDERKHSEHSKHLQWLVEQSPKLFDKFGPYLRFPVK